MREKDGKNFTMISRLNHWGIAVFFLAMLGFGFYLAFGDIPRADKGPLMGLHKALGVVFLAFASWRVIWRLAQGFPKDIAIMPNWQSLAAKATHWALLAAVIIMPVSGVLMSIFSGRAVNVFDIVTIPAQPKNEAIQFAAHNMHEIAPYIIAALILLHAAAAVKHHAIDKDATLKRMLTRIEG
ncbi:MAG: cytochrome b [Bdellovibrionales bacterium]